MLLYMHVITCSSTSECVINLDSFRQHTLVRVKVCTPGTSQGVNTVHVLRPLRASKIKAGVACGTVPSADFGMQLAWGAVVMWVDKGVTRHCEIRV